MAARRFHSWRGFMSFRCEGVVELPPFCTPACRILDKISWKKCFFIEFLQTRHYHMCNKLICHQGAPDEVRHVWRASSLTAQAATCICMSAVLPGVARLCARCGGGCSCMDSGRQQGRCCPVSDAWTLSFGAAECMGKRSSAGPDCLLP